MGFADVHQRTAEQVRYDEGARELLIESIKQNPRFGAREHRRWIEGKLGPRPGGGRGLNAQEGRRII